jgi:hypothetical protein
MLGVADYGSFVVAVIVFLMIPGPGNLALITSTGKGGLRGGLGATFGVIAGDQVLMWLAVAGVAALLAAWPPAFYAVQWLGAAYLGWLGLRMLLMKPGDGALAEGALASPDHDGSGLQAGRNSYLQARWMPPDPPPGHGVHRYAFQLFALDAGAPAFSPTPGRDEVLEMLRDHAVASGCLIGTYERPDTSIKEGEGVRGPLSAVG